MKATSQNMLKLQELSQERNEVKAELSEHFWLQQDSLPQELITAWGGFERLEKEAQMVEAEAFKEIEGEIVGQYGTEEETVKWLKFWRICFFSLLLPIVLNSGTKMLIGDISQYHYQPNDFTGCNGSSSFFICL